MTFATRINNPRRFIALASALAVLIVTLAPMTAQGTGGSHHDDKCYDDVVEQLWERQKFQKQERTRHKEWRWIREHKDVQGWKYHNGSWKNQHDSNWYEVPAHLIEAANFDPRSVASSGSVSLSFYQGPHVSVQYRFVIDGPSAYTTGPSPYGVGSIKVDERWSDWSSWSNVGPPFYADSAPSGSSNGSSETKYVKVKDESKWLPVGETPDGDGWKKIEGETRTVKTEVDCESGWVCKNGEVKFLNDTSNYDGTVYDTEEQAMQDPDCTPPSGWVCKHGDVMFLNDASNYSGTLYDTKEQAEQDPGCKDIDLDVHVTAGVCDPGANGAFGSVNVTIDPDSGATVYVYSDQAHTNLIGSTDMSASIGGLAPGTYYWEIEVADGYAFDGKTTGKVVIDDCEVKVQVKGECVLDGDTGDGLVEVNISVDGGATVVITDSDDNPVATLTKSGTVSVPEGAKYSWAATAADGFDLKGKSSGEIDIEECTRSIDVVVNGVCENDIPILTWQVTPVNFTASEVTITWNDIDPANPLYSSTEPLTGSMIWPGADVENGVAVDWPGWHVVDGAWEQGSDGFENTRPMTSITFDVNPTMTVDVEYPGGEPTCAGPPGEIIVEKVVGPDSPDRDFEFETEGFVLGDNTLAHGQSSSSGPLLPGTYGVSEIVPDGWQAPGVTCVGNGTYEPDAIDLDHGEVVTCTFVNNIDDPLVNAAIFVTVNPTCAIQGGSGEGRIHVGISVDDGATVVIRDSSGAVVGTLSQDGTIVVPEGATYTWEATPADGFEFPPGFESSGEIVIDRCSEPIVGASIEVTVDGRCELDGEVGTGYVDVVISVDDGATVVVRDSAGNVVGTLTEDGTITVAEGATYTWEATPADGFEFPAGADSSGTITIERCSDLDELPFTGFDLDTLVAFAAALLGAGVLLLGSTQAFGKHE